MEPAAQWACPTSDVLPVCSSLVMSLFLVPCLSFSIALPQISPFLTETFISTCLYKSMPLTLGRNLIILSMAWKVLELSLRRRASPHSFS